jgi:N-acetylmuramoyl-L-alanine amidase
MRKSLRVLAVCSICLGALSPCRCALGDPDPPQSNSRRVSAITNEPLGEAAPSRPRLAKGSTSGVVRKVQKILNADRKKRGLGAIGTDGIFGNETYAALREFQGAHQVARTGVTDLDTWHQLDLVAAQAASGNAAPAAPAAGNNAAPADPAPTAGIANLLDGRPAKHDPMELSAKDLDELARIVQAEAGVCSEDGMIAVAGVVLNRVRAGYADGSVHGVISERDQFSAYGDSDFKGTPSDAAVAAAKAAAAGADPSNGALYYFNPYLVSPGWERGMKQTARIGTDEMDTHVFFR